MDLPAGGLVTQGSIAAMVVPAQDMSVVGCRGAGGAAAG